MKFYFIVLISLLIFSIVNIDTVDIGIEENIQQSENIDISSYKIFYVKNTKIVNIEESMILHDNDEFSEYEHLYKVLIAQKFTPKQIKTIKEIVITNTESFSIDGVSDILGVCLNKRRDEYSSTILIASKHDDHLYTLLHECCHALYFNNSELFDSKYKNRWIELNQYVSNYAHTSIKEDFAETGASYLSKRTVSDDCKEKLKLFEEFYNETK